MMVIFTPDQWLGNKWASIDIQPVEAQYFLRILFHLSYVYGFAMPTVIDILDGYTADFKLDSSQASIHIDNYTFSIAFERTEVCNRVLSHLQALPEQYFDGL